MRKYLSIVLIFMAGKFVACDVCGAFMGITPYDNQSQLMLLHRYRVFNGYRNYQQTSKFFIPGAYKTMHDPGKIPGDTIYETKNYTSKDYETFKVIELRGKYFLHPRWEVNFICPIQQIKTKYDGEKNENTGLADPSLFMAYHLIKRLSGYTTRQRLILGAGIKFPVGNYNKMNDDGLRYYLLTQNGTGSWDHFYYINYILSRKRFGVNLNTLYKVNGTNRKEERMSNSINQTISLFVKTTLKNVRLFPSALMSYEYAKGLYVNSNLEKDSKVNVILLGPSLDVVYKKVVFNAAYQFNAYERVYSHSLSNAGRLVFGITFNLDQNKYLIKNKAD